MATKTSQEWVRVGWMRKYLCWCKHKLKDEWYGMNRMTANENAWLHIYIVKYTQAPSRSCEKKNYLSSLGFTIKWHQLSSCQLENRLIWHVNPYPSLSVIVMLRLDFLGFTFAVCVKFPSWFCFVVHIVYAHDFNTD